MIKPLTARHSLFHRSPDGMTTTLIENGDLVPALKDVKQNIGEQLNKAIAQIEDENAPLLDGVLKNNINFNAVKGKTKIPDQKWKDLLDHFNQPRFRACERELRVSRSCSAPPTNT